MKSDKIKIEIDLLRDSLRNIFFVMFAIMSGEVSLAYRILHSNKFNYFDLILAIIGFVVLFILVQIKKTKIKK